MRFNQILPMNSILRFCSQLLMTLLLVGLLSGCGGERTIVNDLDERESNEILVYLSNKGINANKSPTPAASGGASKVPHYNINVDDNQANEAMSLLNQVGLPRRRGQNLLSIFANTGLVPSGLQDKIRYQAGLAEQIASTIRKIDGVLEADVQISYPEEDPLNPTAAKGKITTSVYVKHNGVLDDPNAHLTTRIKRLVAGSINGLDYDNVTVIGDRARYGDATSQFMANIGDEGRQYVNVWSIIMAKDSVTKFRIIFFSFTITIFILLLTLIWLIWKLLPILRNLKKRKQLMTLQPVQPEELAEEEGKAEKKDDDEESEDEDEDESDEEEEEKK